MDTRTLIPFLERMKIEEQSPKYIVANAGYVSESNYRYLEDVLPEHTALIPYSTMLKEKSKKVKELIKNKKGQRTVSKESKLICDFLEDIGVVVVEKIEPSESVKLVYKN